ncbi:unnamed protein product [Hymenolepis diminuta]|uniref:Microsomal glutathione S-transferase 3 n=2 Tax=Hymenolepis diminuta TaxID=6216 RepID=A0A564Y452_HYMDI|nr:unnamed protein product [Hymenolepis diminuta]
MLLSMAAAFFNCNINTMGHMSRPLFPSLRDFPVALPHGYGGVILVGVGAFALHFYFATRVMKARKELDFPCPNMYHPTNTEFNCIQRAHQSYLEVMPFFLSGLYIGGLNCPVGASLLGVTFLAGRLVYFHGYTSGDPDNRRHGRFGCFALLLMMVLNAFFGMSHLRASFKCPDACLKPNFM